MQQFDSIHNSINENERNWAGNLTYGTSQILRPTNIEAVQQIVSESQKLRVLGSKHSFNRIADSNHRLVSLEKLNRILDLDTKSNLVTIEAGCRYGDIAPVLDKSGFALHNLASLPHITVAGAISTATHGSGILNRSLASAVQAIEFVDANGELHQCSAASHPDIFEGLVVSLGTIGVITKLTLNLLPRFDMQQYVYLDLPMESLKANFEAILTAAYSISLFTDWDANNISEVWVKRKSESTDVASEFFGAILAMEDVHPIHGESAENVTTQRGIPRTWYERLPHFKMGFKPSAGAELQSEYFVPFEHAIDAITAIQQLQVTIKPHLLVSEIRTIAADTFWLSPFYQRKSVALHFTWKQHTEAVRQLLPLIEAALKPFDVRPHWGKLFTMPSDAIQKCYERLEDFKKLASRFDPAGKFRNDFITDYIFNGKA